MKQRNKAIDCVKLVACAAMLMDHLRFVFPSLHWVYWPGRLAMPLFLWAYAQTVHAPTWAGVSRLATWAAIAMPGSCFLMGAYLNPLGTFAVGLAVFLCPPLLVLASQFSRWIDFGAWGVLAVALAVWWKPKKTPEIELTWVPPLPRDFFPWFYVVHVYLLAACKGIMSMSQSL